MAKQSKGGLVIVVFLAFLGMVACIHHVVSSHSAEDQFGDDVAAHGIPLDHYWAPGNNLGSDVCKDIKAGQAAADVVINVSHQSPTGTTIPQAEIIVYYAITDICPDLIGQRQDHWRNGT